MMPGRNKLVFGRLDSVRCSKTDMQCPIPNGINSSHRVLSRHDYLCPMIQQVLVGLVFLAALGFLAAMVIRSFRAKQGCATGCGKCGVEADAVPLRSKP